VGRRFESCRADKRWQQIHLGATSVGWILPKGFEPDVALSPNDRYAAMIGEQGNAQVL